MMTYHDKTVMTIRLAPDLPHPAVYFGGHLDPAGGRESRKSGGSRFNISRPSGLTTRLPIIWSPA